MGYFILGLHSLCIPPEDFWGLLEFFEGKRGDGKSFRRQEGGMPFFRCH